MIKIPNLWTPRGEVDRPTYFLTGLALMAVKYALDCTVARYGFHRAWPIANYISFGTVFHVEGAPAGNISFYITMLALALPFIWIGTAMTMRRLRDCGLPLALALFFMMRPLNWLLIALLTFLPSRSEASQIPDTAPVKTLPPKRPRFLGVPIPGNYAARVTFAMVITLIISLGLTWLCVNYFGDYSWAVFVGLPLLIGFLPAWINS